LGLTASSSLPSRSSAEVAIPDDRLSKDTQRPAAGFRFYAELNDFLPPERRFVCSCRSFPQGSTVKHEIEALGVPHTAVEVILANGTSVDFSYRLRGGDHISVYPMFESLDISPILRVRARPLRDPRFVLDVHLGRLARHLRLLGFDAAYGNEATDDELVLTSVGERRTLLTRDVGLLKRGAITHGYYVRARDPGQQAAEVVRRFDLRRLVSPFGRCLHCNGVLREASKVEVLDRLQPRTRLYYDEFRLCIACGRVYWKGSHYEHLARVVADLTQAAAEGPEQPRLQCPLPGA